MKLTEALRKSNVVKRASQPEIYEVSGTQLIIQGDLTKEPQHFDLETMNANDWNFQILKWVGSSAKKSKKESVK